MQADRVVEIGNFAEAQKRRRRMRVAPERALSRREVAALIGKCVSSVDSYCRRGENPMPHHVHPVTGFKWFRGSEVMAWMEGESR